LTGVSEITITYDVPVAMRDGTVLVADVYRPSTPDTHPAILIRTPYGKRSFPTLGPLSAFDVLATVRAGYVVVIQDVRGSVGSEGELRFFSQEPQDGADTIAWVAAQPWCDGAVGLSGPSYLGAAQLLAAITSPPSVRAIAPTLTPSEYYEGWTHMGGAFQLGFVLRWSLDTAYATVASRPNQGEQERRKLERAIANVWELMWTLPLRDLVSVSPWLSQLGEWLEHPDRDEFWRATAINERYPDILVPALHIAGWHDIFLKGSLQNFVGLRAAAGTEPARANQRLIVSPWGHAAPNEYLGDVWFGRDAHPGIAGLDREQVAFFNAFLKGGAPPDRAPVRIFVMGANRWRDEHEWPLQRAVPTRFYLRDGGRLTTQEPDADTSVEFAYDPRDPVPTVGGNTLLPGSGFFLGPRDRRGVQTRADVVIYTTDVLQEDLEVTGPLLATLHVATSALDTDFTVALVDVYPDGRAIGIADGILRLRYRDGFDQARLAEPGHIYRIEVDLIATSNVFLSGHRVRVEVSSSNFPRFDRNPNNGGVVADATEADLTIANQRIFHDPVHSSYITLPVVA
jgi:putative CocE/NonD family hydrolase